VCEVAPAAYPYTRQRSEEDRSCDEAYCARGGALRHARPRPREGGTECSPEEGACSHAHASSPRCCEHRTALTAAPSPLRWRLVAAHALYAVCRDRSHLPRVKPVHHSSKRAGRGVEVGALITDHVALLRHVDPIKELPDVLALDGADLLNECACARDVLDVVALKDDLILHVG